MGDTVSDVGRAYERIIERFVAWAHTEDAIRAAVVIGSRARTDHPADEWADLDIVIWTTNPAQYLTDAGWAATLGEPWISFVEASPDARVRERRVLFAGGLDVDFAFLGLDTTTKFGENLADIAGVAFGRGARVLLDRDGVVPGLLALGRDATPAPPPDAAGFNQAASDFWYHAVWTAKHLRRGELWWAKASCDVHMKELLRTVLEWDAAAEGRDHWFRGRFLEEWADPDAVKGLARAFARYDEEDTWAALAVTMDLFSHAARRLASALPVPYPDLAEDRARALVREYQATRDGVRKNRKRRSP